MHKKTTSSKKDDKVFDILLRIILILTIAIVLFMFAIRPMFFNKDYYFEAGSDVTFGNLGKETDKNSYDVVVIGDTLDGISAALGAARVGAETLLISESSQPGDALKNAMNVSWGLDISPNGNIVSSDFYKEIRYKAGEGSNIQNYMKAISEMLTDSKKLTVMSGKLESAVYQDGKISEITVKSGQSVKTVRAQRYIDSTKNGELLSLCGVEKISGYSDIGIEGLYPPVKLNFMVSGVEYTKLQALVQNQSAMMSILVNNYKTSDNNFWISGFNVTDQGESKVIIEAISVRNVDLSSEEKVAKAYEKAKTECIDFYNFLKLNIDEFKNSTGVSVAERFVMSSPYHYQGRYKLKLSDIITGKRFTDRVSTAARPVTLTMLDGTRYILYNPKVFYVPLGALIPAQTKNILMTGDKISAASLVQGVLASNSSLTGSGYAAGIIAAYSISKDIEIPMIIEDHNLDTQQEIEKVLRKLGIYMSDVKEDFTSITGNWSFPSVEKLSNLGLLSAGITNDFKYDKESKCMDLAYMLLNGVPRVSRAAYSYSFDAKIRKYLTDDPLTKENLGKILLELNNINTDKDYYKKACEAGLVDTTLQNKLEGKNVMKYSEVYYAAVLAIEKLTGKVLEDEL